MPVDPSNANCNQPDKRMSNCYVRRSSASLSKDAFSCRESSILTGRYSTSPIMVTFEVELEELRN